jgi:hypothetical protein
MLILVRQDKKSLVAPQAWELNGFHLDRHVLIKTLLFPRILRQGAWNGTSSKFYVLIVLEPLFPDACTGADELRSLPQELLHRGA